MASVASAVLLQSTGRQVVSVWSIWNKQEDARHNFTQNMSHRKIEASGLKKGVASQQIYSVPLIQPLSNKTDKETHRVS